MVRNLVKNIAATFYRVATGESPNAGIVLITSAPALALYGVRNTALFALFMGCLNIVRPVANLLEQYNPDNPEQGFTDASIRRSPARAETRNTTSLVPRTHLRSKAPRYTLR